MCRVKAERCGGIGYKKHLTKQKIPDEGDFLLLKLIVVCAFGLIGSFRGVLRFNPQESSR